MLAKQAKRAPLTVHKQAKRGLHREIFALEIKVALNQFNPNKVVGLDGMSTLFFQQYWHIVGDDVTKVILSFLNNDASLDYINQ
ncbi:hypothetical protein DITRI_Ditri16bG0075300 [Diplodiscus trichospermus]